MCRRVRMSDGRCLVQAHHSVAGVSDMSAEGEVAGTLTKIQFVNPHGSMTITVKKADGTTIDWMFTTGSATTLAQRGISKIGPNALHAGDASLYREVHPGAERQSVGVSQVDYASGRPNLDYLRGQRRRLVDHPEVRRHREIDR